MTGLVPLPAIFFHPDQIEGEGRDLVGRRSAGESFLRAWVRHVTAPELRFVIDQPDHEKPLRAKLAALGDTRPVRATALRGGGDFTDAGTVFFPTPGYQGATWLRQRFGPARCSLVGLTHTVSTRRIIEGFHELHSEPCEDWDAIICTSRAVQSVVAQQFAHEAAYFRARFGAARVPQPQLPVIPLGINADDFAPRDGARARMRTRFGAPDDAVVVLTMGRLSVVEKANPVPLLMALEMVARQSGRPVHLWLTGWASRAEEEELHRAAAAAICRKVVFHLIDGRDAQVRRDIWAGADIFTLPSDSIQETFGLVPVEAMAAGLPVVMPDWDGFRDTVVDGETGFLIPTRMARPGTGGALARRFADGTDGYLQYLTLVQSMVQIDVPAYADALAALVTDAALRARMGAAGAAHVRAHLDWSAVIPRYLSLAEDLAQRRTGSVPASLPLSDTAISPLEIDPFTLYAGYPTEHLRPETRLAVGQTATPELIEAIDRFSGRKLYKRHAMAADMTLRIWQVVADGRARTVAELGRALRLSRDQAEASVLYLAKADLLRLSQPDDKSDPPRL